MKSLRHWWKKLKMKINGKIFYVHESEELVLLKCPLPKAIYWFGVISVKIPMTFFAEMKNIILNYFGATKFPK